MFDLIPFRRHRHIRRFGDELESLMERFFGEDLFPSFGRDFKADIKETDKEYIIEAELPGFNKDDIEIELYDNQLVISAKQNEIIEEEKENYICRERRSGSFKRSFFVDNIKQDQVDAKYENGILKIILPKKDTGKGRGRRINIR